MKIISSLSICVFLCLPLYLSAENEIRLDKPAKILKDINVQRMVPDNIIDVVTTTRSLGETIVSILGSKRCTYVEKSKYGGFNPSIVCTRPWKKTQCEQLLEQELAKSSFQKIKLYCKYLKTRKYSEALNQAEQILMVLNSPGENVETIPGADENERLSNYALSTDMSEIQFNGTSDKNLKKSGLTLKEREHIILQYNCTTTWDPLTLKCKDLTALNLSKYLSDGTLPRCLPDSNKDGAEVPCYGN